MIRCAQMSSSLGMTVARNEKGPKTEPLYQLIVISYFPPVDAVGAACFATTSPTITRFLTGVLAFEVTTIVLLNGYAAAAL